MGIWSAIEAAHQLELDPEQVKALGRALKKLPPNAIPELIECIPKMLKLQERTLKLLEEIETMMEEGRFRQ